MRRVVGIAALVGASGAIAFGSGSVVRAGATTVPPAPVPVTTVAAAATTVAAPPTTTPGAATTLAPTTTVGPTVPARPAARIASPVPDEKIRPTDLPVRTIVITLAVVIAGLAVVGFAYGKIRSRPRPPKSVDVGTMIPPAQLAPPPPAALAPPAPRAPASSSPAPLPPPTAPPGAPPGGDTSLFRPPSR